MYKRDDVADWPARNMRVQSYNSIICPHTASLVDPRIGNADPWRHYPPPGRRISQYYAASASASVGSFVFPNGDGRAVDRRSVASGDFESIIARRTLVQVDEKRGSRLRALSFVYRCSTRQSAVRMLDCHVRKNLETTLQHRVPVSEGCLESSVSRTGESFFTHGTCNAPGDTGHGGA